MSIVAYTGLPGSGKSYSVVKHQILPALKAGRNVVTNLPLRMDALDTMALRGTVTEFPLEAVEAEPEKLYDYFKPGCVFVLDEAWKLFPQGKTADKVPEPFKRFLAEHRHMVNEQGDSAQIVLVVQDLANIGAFARRLVENTFVTTKLGFVGLNKSYRVDVFHGAQTGATPPVSKRLRMLGPHRYSKDVFALYKSHTMAANDDQDGAKEDKIDGRANILKTPAFIIGAILCPLFIWFGVHMARSAFHSGMGTFGKPAPPGAPAASDARSGAKRADAPAAPGFARPVEKLHETIRVVGEILGPGTPAERGGYLADGARLFVLSGSACRVVAAHVQCSYNGNWYDAAGLVGPAAQGPLTATR